MARGTSRREPKAKWETFGVVLTTCRNKFVLDGAIADRLERLLEERCSELGLSLKDVDANFFYVQFVIGNNTRDYPEDIVRSLKKFTAHHLRREFQELLTMPGMWSRVHLLKGGRITPKERREFLSSAFNRCKGIG